MATQVLMPSLGESVDEGTLTKWLKAIGDTVEEFEPLLEVNTDKVDTEIPCPAGGVLLQVLVAEGSTIQAGQLLAWIGEAGEEPPWEAPTDQVGEEPTPEIHPAAEALPTGGGGKPSVSPRPGRDQDLGFISPLVAKIAADQRVDIAKVPGSGQGGRITKNDILAYVERRGSEAPGSAASGTGPLTGDVLPLNAVRRLTAEHMLRSVNTSPHVSTIMEVDLSGVIAHRQANKESFAGDGVRLTLTPYFVAASVAALQAYPIVNSSWGEGGILLHRGINIGIATSLGEAGLIVPVIKNAESLSLLGLARSVNDLAERARARKLQPDEVQGGTFTITNHGVSGSLFATPIINQPQCAILGLGAIQKRVVVISDEGAGDSIAIRPMAYLGLTFDHRILDGAIADYFLGVVVESLQGWR